MKRFLRKKKKLKNKSKRRSQILSRPKNKPKKSKCLQLKRPNQLQTSTYKLLHLKLLIQNQSPMQAPPPSSSSGSQMQATRFQREARIKKIVPFIEF